MRSTRVHQPGGPHRKVARVGEVGHERAQARLVEAAARVAARRRGERPARSPGWRAASASSSRAKITSSRGCARSARSTTSPTAPRAARSRRIDITGVMPLPPLTKSSRAGVGSGNDEVARRGGRGASTSPGRSAIVQPAARRARRATRLTVIATQRSAGRGRDRVAAPHAHAVDLDLDRDVYCPARWPRQRAFGREHERLRVVRLVARPRRRGRAISSSDHARRARRARSRAWRSRNRRRGRRVSLSVRRTHDVAAYGVTSA